MHQDDVGEFAGVAAQHAHDGGDAAARRDEQRLGRCARGEREVAGGLAEVNEGAGLRLTDEVAGHHAVPNRLDGDGDVAGGRGRGRDRVRAPLPHAPDVDANPDVLAGAMPLPAAAHPDADGHRIGRFPVDGVDATAEVTGAAERCDQVEEVAWHQGRRDHLGDGPQRTARGSSEKRSHVYIVIVGADYFST